MKLFQSFRLPSLAMAVGSFALILLLNFGFSSGTVAQTPAPETTQTAPSPNASPSPKVSPADSKDKAPQNPEDKVEIAMTVLGFDPIKGEVEARLEFTPKGKYAMPDGDYVSQNLLLTTNNVDKQGSEITFRDERFMDAVVVRYTTIEGDVHSYPFDNYTSEMTIYLDSTGSVDPDEATDFKPVPMEFTSVASIPGFEIDISPVANENKPELVSMEIDIKRSSAAQFFSLVVMFIMWTLSILAFLLAVRVWRSGKLPETAMLGLMAALLFAFPAIRNAQPNVPPVGTLSDFLSFLWTESLVVLALMILGSCWLRRYSPPEKVRPN